MGSLARYPQAMKFIVDNNVGKLAGMLRVLGYDTLFINPIEDGELVEIARREGRVLLTKDRDIFRRRPVASSQVRALRIEGDDWRAQLAQVVRAFHLQTQPQFTRCLECNTPLQPRTREEAQPHVPPHVYRTHSSFHTCPTCGRHYWKGTHWQRINRDLGQLLQG